MIMPTLMQSAPGPETVIDGVRYLYFGGTNYLGLAGHPEVIEAGCRAMRAYGVHSATSRAGFGTTPPVLEVEHQAAAYFCCEDAYYFSSGYLGNQILLAAVMAEADGVLVDASAHFSVWEAAKGAGRPVRAFAHGDVDQLARAARDLNRVVVMADAVGPVTGDLTPVFEYKYVLEQHERGVLLLDDAHGFGVLGPAGRGWLDELGLWEMANRGDFDERVSLVCGGTLAKALGGFGGLIPGTRSFVERLRKASHCFEGASAPPSAAAGASVKALELAQLEPDRRERVRANTLRLRRGLRSLGLTVAAGPTANFGVRIGCAADMRRIHQALRTRGIFLPYFSAYSGVSGEGLMRFAVFADHTPEQLDHLLAELKAVL
jgi:8-amino-7-oxononanoate synthase